MQTFRLTAKKYSGGYFIYYTGTSRLAATYKKYYPDHYGTIELNDGTTLFPVNSLSEAKKLLMEKIQTTGGLP